MRLTKLKIAGFKSFVDPTTVTFPSSLTGVVGPNGCGKSNIIDAVRWVMGEISAKHLRGESMADVIFNGSSSRKPLGQASVELVFDNSDGKIGGPYASYNEVALKRAVSRDGTSDYFINGLKVRRKDITQLFLGTGLGTRSYAIIEQGMISRVIEARPDDLRAFLEEAAGISRYKERRRETESRIGHTRENLDRLNDLREEVEKQIRHLQRQAATARRYQTLKEEERKLSAELLALRLQSLDLEAGVRDAATSGCETAMQAVLADLREAEAQIERIRADQSAKADALNAIQGRYYEAGAEVTRIEQGIEYSRELQARQRADLEQIDSQTAELDRVVQLDRVQLEALSMELSTMVPGLDEAHERERVASQALERCEQALTSWQFSWDNHAQAVALGTARDAGGTGAHRAIGKPAAAAAAAARAPRIGTRVVCAAAAPGGVGNSGVSAPMPRAPRARAPRQNCKNCCPRSRRRGNASERRVSRSMRCAPACNRRRESRSRPKRCSRPHSAKPPAESRNGSSRSRSIAIRASRSSCASTRVGSAPLRPCWAPTSRRCASTGLDSVTDLLASFDGGYLAVVSTGEGAGGAHVAASLRAKVQGATVLGSVLSAVLTADTLGEALKLRRQLKAGESVVTARWNLAGQRLAACVARRGCACRRDRARGNPA